MAQDTILEQFSELGVDVNGLVVPGRSIEHALSSHSFNVIINNNHDTFKLSLAGSGTAVRYRGREILLTTQHQLRSHDESCVAMLTDSGSHIITSGGMRRYNMSIESDAKDIVAFDFTEPCAAFPELKRRFFELNKAPPNALNVNILAILLSGFPSDDQIYELHEK